METARQYDIVIYGATGFTGRLVAEYMVARGGDGLRWALAGRDAGKLAALRDDIGAPAATPLLAHLRRTLDDGEAEALALATELPECLLLLDDADGRETALQMGLEFTGTVGVLLRAKRVGKLPAVKPVLDQLIEQHRFRLSRNLYEALLRRAGEVP